MSEADLRLMLINAFYEGCQVGEMWALTGRDPDNAYRDAMAERVAERTLAARQNRAGETTND